MIRVDREALARMLPELERRVERRTRAVQAEGAAAKVAGAALVDCQHCVGSWMWKRWAEGWSGKICPEREVSGGSFTMTPRKELVCLIEWLGEIGASEAARATAEAMFRRSYTPEALGSTN